MSQTEMNLVPTLIVEDGQPMADSRDVAVFFGRSHFNVLAAYRNLKCSDEFRELNYQAFKINDLTGESLSHVLMTKDGFTFLVMGFTGPKAAAFKEAYIARFNEMDAELRRRTRNDVFALPSASGSGVTRSEFRDDMKRYCTMLSDSLSAQIEATTSDMERRLRSEIKHSAEDIVREAVRRTMGGVGAIISNQQTWERAGMLPSPAANDENSYVTATEVCWMVVDDADLHTDVPAIIGRKLVEHARKNRWPQGATEVRSRRDRPTPTYPLGRIKQWLADGGIDFIETENRRRTGRPTVVRLVA